MPGGRRTIDVGVITGSGIYALSAEAEERRVETRFGSVGVSVSRVGDRRLGGISRHGPGHRFLPHAIPHRANLLAFEQLGARAVLASTAVGAVDPTLPLGRPVLFDELFFPDNRLPDGGACTVFTEPDDPRRGHLIWHEPFAPRLRRRVEQAADDLGLDIGTGGVYGHTNGPRIETRAETDFLRSAGVTAVSQTCGPEVVLAGELGIPYALVGFPVNYAPGVGEAGTREDLERRLQLSKRVLPRLIFRTVELIGENDFVFDHGYVYRVEGGV